MRNLEDNQEVDNSAYMFALKIQQKYGDRYQITVAGRFSDNSALILIKEKQEESNPQQEVK